MGGGHFFLQLLWLEAVAPLIAPSGLGRGEPSVIIPAGAFGPKAQMVVPLGTGGDEPEAPMVR